MFLKNRNVIFKMKKSKVTDYEALMRIPLQLQKYNIEVINKSGKDIPVRYFLSHASLPDIYLNLVTGLDLHVHTVLQHLLSPIKG